MGCRPIKSRAYNIFVCTEISVQLYRKFGTRLLLKTVQTYSKTTKNLLFGGYQWGNNRQARKLNP